jgi:dTDP-4-dehydrorhamnose 3,5-epimerase|tara:strand:- start:10608 stop:11186 length:579 start_codon:yes stop_codon:yes gene_type:complete
MKKVAKEKSKNFNDVFVFTPRVFHDHRGCFYESYNENTFKEAGFNEIFVQDNFSISRANVIRGLHYQWDGPMGKFVKVASGAIMDVIVDVRKGSPTYGVYESFMLTAENKKELWVPPGYAHGIISLEDNTVLHYKCTAVYNSDGESGINPLDPELNIDWGIDKSSLILSEKDSAAQSFSEYRNNPKFNFKDK